MMSINIQSFRHRKPKNKSERIQEFHDRKRHGIFIDGIQQA